MERDFLLGPVITEQGAVVLKWKSRDLDWKYSKKNITSMVRYWNR